MELDFTRPLESIDMEFMVERKTSRELPEVVGMLDPNAIMYSCG